MNGFFDHAVEVDRFETMLNTYGFAPVGDELDDQDARFWEQVSV